MSSKTKTKTKAKQDQNIKFDQAGLAGYRKLQNPLLATLQAYMEDPQKNAFTQLRTAQGQRSIDTAFGGQAQNVMGNLTASGLTGAPSAFVTSQLSKIGRARSGATSQNVIQNILFGEQLRRGAAAQAQAYRPLTTGASGTSEQTTVQKTSPGLTDIIGAIAPALLAGFTGGAGPSGISNWGAASAAGSGAAIPGAPYPGFLNATQAATLRPSG